MSFRMGICRKVLDGIIDKIERTEGIERKREEKKRVKEEHQAQKVERQKAHKLDILLQKRKEALKREMVKKRDLLERDLILKLQQTNRRKRGRRISQSSADGSKPKKKKKVEDQPRLCVCNTPYDPTE